MKHNNMITGITEKKCLVKEMEYKINLKFTIQSVSRLEEK